MNSGGRSRNKANGSTSHECSVLGPIIIGRERPLLTCFVLMRLIGFRPDQSRQSTTHQPRWICDQSQNQNSALPAADVTADCLLLTLPTRLLRLLLPLISTPIHSILEIEADCVFIGLSIVSDSSTFPPEQCRGWQILQPQMLTFRAV